MSALRSFAWLRRECRPAGVVLLAAAFIGSPAHAGKDTLLDVLVVPLALSVNVSVPTSLGFTVDIQNNKSSGMATNVRFTAPVTTSMSNVQVVSAHAGIPAPSCSHASSTLSCSFGNLAAGQSVPQFLVFFDTTKTGTVTFDTTTYYAEGEGPNANKRNSSVVPEPVPFTVVGAVDPDTAATVVPQRGGGSVVFKTLESDKWSTKVNVPTSAASYALGFISEVPNTEACNNFFECFDSKLDIKRKDGFDFDPYLTITLHVHAENVKPGTQSGSLVLFYAADDLNFAPVYSCTPFVAYPCLFGDPIVTKVPGRGNSFTFNVISPFNGSYRLP